MQQIYRPWARTVGATAIVFLASCGGSVTGTERRPDDLVATVIVDPAVASVVVGSEVPLRVQVQDANGQLVPDAEIVWSVKDPSIASVSQTGVVTAIAIGTTQVAASSNGKSGLASLTVQRPPVASVAVRPQHLDMVVGAHSQLSALTYDVAGATLTGRAATWATSNQAVATVDAAGNVSAISVGSATITATSEGKTDAATVTVNGGPVATIAISPSPLSLTVGQTSQLAVTLRDASGAQLTGRTIVWSSSNAGVASVSSAGLVSAMSTGTATITATSEGKTGSTTVSVSNAPVASVTLSPTSLSLVPGQASVVTATLTDASGATLTNRVVAWKTSNSAIATVSSAGTVTAVGLGNATITATSEGKTATVAVLVKEPTAVSVTVTPALKDVRVGRTITLVATAVDVTGAPIVGRTFTWTSADANIASVSSSGVVTGRKVGVVTITATLDGKSDSSVITVLP